MYEVVFSEEALKYISTVNRKERENIKNIVVLCLGKYLQIRYRRCNKKHLKGSDPKTYRLHISMKHTLFYWIDEESQKVKIIDAMGINQAHNKYKKF